MIEVTYALSHWLQKHDINPEDVTLRIEADSKVQSNISRCIKQDLDPMLFIGNPNAMYSRFNLHGIKVRID